MIEAMGSGPIEDWILDLNATRSTANYLRAQAEPQALIVPSVAFLDRRDRYGLVIYRDRIDPRRRSDSQSMCATSCWSPRREGLANRMLDIVIEPDLSWCWKDEEEIQEAVAAGLVIREWADDVRREGERMLKRLEERRSPFCDGWERWLPDPAWPIPELPVGWDDSSK